MKRIILISLLVVVGISLMTSTTYAQEMKPQLYVVADVIVKPSMERQFIAAVKEEVAVYSKYKFPYSWRACSTGDNHYYFLIPVKNFADIDNFYKAGEEIADRGAEEYQAMLNKFKETYEYLRFSVFTYTPELSFLPENPEPAAGEANYRFWDFHFVKPGMTNEYEAVIKESMALSKRKNTTQTWYTWVGGMGADQPLYIYVAVAKNAVDFYSQNMKMWESIGEEGSKLYQKWMAYVRKREVKTGRYRPNLSYAPEKE